MTRSEAIDRFEITYFTGRPCRRGHTSERYVSNGACLTCYEEHERRKAERRRGRPAVSLPLPKPVTTDWSNLTPAQIDSWYARVRALKPNATRYKHHPLEERQILYAAPTRIKDLA